MGLREDFMDQMKASMKAGDAPRTSTLRMILAKLKDTDIASRPKGIEKVPDDEVRSSGTVELYNLAEDIGETKNLAASRPDKVKELRARLDELLKNAAPPGNAAAKPAGRNKTIAK